MRGSAVTHRLERPLLFLTSRILETELYHSDRFAVGFGLSYPVTHGWHRAGFFGTWDRALPSAPAASRKSTAWRGARPLATQSLMPAAGHRHRLPGRHSRRVPDNRRSGKKNSRWHRRRSRTARVPSRAPADAADPCQQKLFSVIATIVVVLGTLYALVHQGESPRSTGSFAASGAVTSDAAGPIARLFNRTRLVHPRNPGRMMTNWLRPILL